MNIDEMEAGRELDALVAEKVMGWYWFQVPKWDANGSLPEQGKVLVPPGFNWDNFEWKPKGIILPYAMMDAHRFFPSTSIADAWEAIEELRERGWYFEIETPAASGGLYDVSVSIRDSKNGTWDSTGQTDGWITEDVVAPAAPLAICRAALKAVL